MRTLKIMKLISLGVLLVASVFAAVALAQPVRLHKSSYTASYSQSSSSKKDKSSNSSATMPTVSVTKPSATKPSATKPSATEPSTTKPSSTKPTTATSSTGTTGMRIYNVNSVKIGLPTEYTSMLSVEKKAESGKTYNVLLRVYEKASKEESLKDMDEALGLLFEIGYVKISKYNDFKKLDYPECKVFAKDSTNYYTYSEPTDYQFYRSDGGTSKEKETWQTLQKIGDKVKTHFLKSNDVVSYTIKPDNDTQVTTPTKPVVTAPTTPAKQDCNYCDGSGDCSNCVFGDCPSCYGKGRFDCVTCLASGECGSCGGYGYVYKGVGQSFRKEECSRCDGSGDCGTCGGKRYSDCRICRNSGNCSICSGTGDCEYCFGSGKKY